MKKIVSTTKAPGAIGPYSQAVTAGGFIYTSGQLPIDGSGVLELADIKRATTNCMNNVKAIIETAGGVMNDIVKTTIFLDDLKNFDAVNEAYAAFFDNEPPARSCIQAAKLPKGAGVEIEAIAYLG